MTVVVIGTGLTETAAALEFARYGVPVTMLEQPNTRPTPRDPEADPDRVIRDWLTEIGAAIRPGEAPLAAATFHEPPTLFVTHGGAWVRVPAGSAFGIPSSPLSTETVQAVGGAAAFRAYLDRITPVLKIGKTQFVGDLVAKRVGRRILDTLVEPQVQYLFGKPSHEVEVSALAPGLNEAETRAGSLTGAALAYADRYRELAGGITPNIGWEALRRGLIERLEYYGAKIIPTVAGHTAGNLSIEERPSGGWSVTYGAESFEARVLIADPYGVTATAAAANLRASDGLISPEQDLVRVQIVMPAPLPDGFPAAPAAGARHTVVGLDTFSVGGLAWTKRIVAPGEGEPWVELVSNATTPNDARQQVTPEGIRAVITAASIDTAASTQTTHSVTPEVTVAPALDGSTGEHAPQEATVENSTSTGNSAAARSFISTAYPAGGRGLHGAISEIREHAKLLRREVLGLT